MSKHNISTLSDLYADRKKHQTEMDKLIDYRQHFGIRYAVPHQPKKKHSEPRNRA